MRQNILRQPETRVRETFRAVVPRHASTSTQVIRFVFFGVLFHLQPNIDRNSLLMHKLFAARNERAMADARAKRIVLWKSTFYDRSCSGTMHTAEVSYIFVVFRFWRAQFIRWKQILTTTESVRSEMVDKKFSLIFVNCDAVRGGGGWGTALCLCWVLSWKRVIFVINCCAMEITVQSTEYTWIKIQSLLHGEGAIVLACRRWNEIEMGYVAMHTSPDVWIINLIHEL